MRSSRRPASAIARALAALVLACAIAGCGALAAQQPGTLVIRNARVAGTADAPMLEIGIDCKLSGPMRDALDHGIPLTFRIRVDASPWRFLPSDARAAHRIELRYFPLSRRYQVRDLDAPVDVLSFATPGNLLASLNAMRLPLPPAFATLSRGTAVRVGVELETASLPGALRLPALFEPAWQLSSAEYTWQAKAG
ncbi:MAG TPA: DUF4390 domain-containing protein [Rhodanobacteraceae bacterium]|nr:DUF4390 domain-containing protein [Rhodanobacteraceae bacterium]